MLTRMEGEWYGGTPDSLWGYALLLPALSCINVFVVWGLEEGEIESADKSSPGPGQELTEEKA